MPARLDLLNIEQGSTFRKKLFIRTRTTESPHEVTKADLRGFTGRMKVKISTSSRKDVLFLTSENEGLNIDNNDGTVNIYITASQTAKLSPKKKYVYDLELVKEYSNLPEPEVIKLINGHLAVSLEETTW